MKKNQRIRTKKNASVRTIAITHTHTHTHTHTPSHASRRASQPQGRGPPFEQEAPAFLPHGLTKNMSFI